MTRRTITINKKFVIFGYAGMAVFLTVAAAQKALTKIDSAVCYADGKILLDAAAAPPGAYVLCFEGWREANEGLKPGTYGSASDYEKTLRRIAPDGDAYPLARNDAQAFET